MCGPADSLGPRASTGIAPVPSSTGKSDGRYRLNRGGDTVRFVRPESFDEDLMDDWSVWVLDNGLPELPATVMAGESVPVARWAGPCFGAVVYVAWSTGSGDEGDALVSEVRVFRRTKAGWQPSSGGGGTDWFDPPFVRPAEIESNRVAVGHLHASGSEGWRCCAVDGLVGAEAAYVEVADDDGVTVRPIESAFGAFVVCSDADRLAAVRVLDRHQRSLLEFQLGE
jgi:hypothetical protein